MYKHAHGEGAVIAAGCRGCSEHGVLRRVWIGVLRLRIELARECDHFFRTNDPRAERKHLPRLEVLEVQKIAFHRGLANGRATLEFTSSLWGGRRASCAIAQ